MRMLQKRDHRIAQQQRVGAGLPGQTELRPVPERAEARGRAVRVAVENMRARSSALYRGHCRPTAGRLTLAVELWQFADEVDRANDVLPPRPPWEPRHGYGTPEMAGMGVIQGG